MSFLLVATSLHCCLPWALSPLALCSLLSGPILGPHGSAHPAAPSLPLSVQWNVWSGAEKTAPYIFQLLRYLIQKPVSLPYILLYVLLSHLLMIRLHSSNLNCSNPRPPLLYWLPSHDPAPLTFAHGLPRTTPHPSANSPHISIKTGLSSSTGFWGLCRVSLGLQSVTHLLSHCLPHWPEHLAR